MSEYSAGKEVLSYCNKCKLTLAHIIIGMKDATTIGRVQCKTCNSTHAFKDPSAATTKKKKTTTRRTKRTPSKTVTELWTEAIAKTTVDAIPYSPRTCFEKGSFIDHKKFGQGFVQGILDNDKIEVMFEKDIKLLIHNK